MRQPLTHCRRADDPSKCKGGFPLEDQLVDVPTVLRHGLAKAMGLATSGRRNMLGAMHCPINEPNLSNCHPALLAGLRCNVNVQLPDRLPIIAETHSDRCDKNCIDLHSAASLTLVLQIAQNAKAGYACDYSNERSAFAVNELKEFCKGQGDLASSLAGQCTAYLAKRAVQRLISDLYGKGIARGAVEAHNLLVYSQDHRPEAAETVRTAECRQMPGKAYVARVERAMGEEALPSGELLLRDGRNTKQKKFVSKDGATM